MSGARRAALVGLALLAITRPVRSQSAAGGELVVFAAASLSAAFQELGAVFERTNPGTRVRFSFAGSQQLAFQLEQGAAADLFASADERWMTHAADLGLLAGSPRVFARNRLVVIVPVTNPGRVGTVQDLARRGTKIVIAAEAVPVGAYTRQMLSRLAQAPGFADGFNREVLANVVSHEENVKAVLSKVQLGEADAGVVYESDLAGPAARHLRTFPIPDAQNVVAEYPLAVLRAARAPEQAEDFAELVLGAEGQAVLRRFGLLPAATSSSLIDPAAAR